MGKKKILMVHNYYQIGGGEHTVFQNEVDLLKENGHIVFTYTRSNDELKHSKLAFLFSPLTTIWSFKTYREIKKIIKINKIDIVHCHNTFPLISPSVYYAARKLKIPVIQTIHNFRLLCPSGAFYCNNNICEACIINNSFKTALKFKCYRNSKLQTTIVILMLKFHRMIRTYKKISYIFLTQFNQSKFDKIVDINSENVFIKPNFADELNNISIYNENQPTFVFAGRLETNKGIDFLLEAWKDVPSNYQLHIYGDGNLKQQVIDAASNYKNISYFGFQTQENIFKDLASSTALLFPSKLYEGYPMILIESCAMGKPVVSTDIGNQNDFLLNSNCGVVFDINDKQSFIVSIKNVIENYSTYSKNAKKYYNENLTKKINYIKLSDIYDSAKHIK